jgi:hypothetical protein
MPDKRRAAIGSIFAAPGSCAGPTSWEAGGAGNGGLRKAADAA